MESQGNETENVIILSTLYNMKSFKKFSVYCETVLSTILCIISNNEIPAEIHNGLFLSVAMKSLRYS